MKGQRVHFLSVVNAKQVSKAGDTYTIRGVVGARDGIVMNGMAYPAEELAASVASLEGKPAPAGHPKNDKGQHISATNGAALVGHWMGSYCTNARHEGGASMVDVVVNAAQAKAHPDGVKLVERLEAAINGENIEPIHVSTGLYCKPLSVNGESGGKKYSRVATQINYDHLAILLNERGAGTPADGVGMFLNADGLEEQVEVVNIGEPQDMREEVGFMKRWLGRLLGNSSEEMSLSELQSALQKALPDGSWIYEVYTRHAIWQDRDGRLWKQDYTGSDAASVAFTGEAVEVVRRIEYEPVNNAEGADIVKETIIAALNSAGIKTEGLSDAQALDAYNQLQAKPVTEKLTAANAKLAEFEQAANAAKQAEIDSLAAELAVNSNLLNVEDFKAMPVERLRELKAAKGAAPVITGNSGGKGETKSVGYDINELMKEGK